MKDPACVGRPCENCKCHGNSDTYNPDCVGDDDFVDCVFIGGIDMGCTKDKHRTCPDDETCCQVVRP